MIHQCSPWIQRDFSSPPKGLVPYPFLWAITTGRQTPYTVCEQTVPGSSRRVREPELT